MKKLSRNLLLAVLLTLTVIIATACSSEVTVPEVVEEPVEAVVEEVEEVVEEVEEAVEEVMEEEAPAEEAEEEMAEEEAPAEEAEEEMAEEEAAEEEMAEEEMMEEVMMAESLDINFALGNNQRTITYNQPTPLEQPDGNVINQGQLKPTWQYIQSELGMTFNDVTIQDQSSGEMIEIAAATGFDSADVFGGSNVADDLMAFGAQGYFVRLNDNLDQMPNFAAYLEANPNIAKAVTAYDGGIYHAPYAAEIGNYARVFNARVEWVAGLLDSDEMIEAETNTLTPQYEGYWERHASNVVDLQNEAAAGGELNAEAARAALLDYIAATYPDLEKPSDLYVGGNAQYDIDELVALWRVVELSPNTVTKITTGEVIPDAQVVPFFTRRSRDRHDALRLINYWGGQRVFGSDSSAALFYLDADGELQFSHNDPGFLEGVGYMQQLYAEGLIYSDFFDSSISDNFRSLLFGADGEEGHNQFGFMTIDWIASTTASNETVASVLPPLTTVGSDDLVHWVENTRVIKPDGWAISTASSEEEINAALALFDYFYSEEGNIVQNYGPPFAQSGGIYVGGDGVEYPEFSQWTVDNANEFNNGNMSSFLRDYMGSLIPLGYQKEIGFEMQTTVNNGPAAWEMYFNAGVQTPTYESEGTLTRLVPPVFSLTEQDTAKLGTLAVGGEQLEQIYLFIANADTAPADIDALAALYADAGIDDYVEVYRNAYERSQQ
ncbi:MAG: hypothetical protein AAGD96_02650 [Chloroflexota bacterium]